MVDFCFPAKTIFAYEAIVALTCQYPDEGDDLKTEAREPYCLLEEVSDLGYGDRDAGNMLIADCG